MRNRIVKIEKNDKEFKIVERVGLSGAVSYMFGCCPKDTTADIDTAQILIASGMYMKVEAISCQGCEWISKEETSKCFARAT
uniref:Uncharacterized protein n=1 Tax=Acrobeloides nanus TaxID=290746 RepID=A0A914EFD5_9BILA